MARKKVKLEFITNDSARKITFKKRKKGLMKKANELSTLCGVEVCAIVFSPYDAEPEVWPPSPLDVQHVLSQFKKITEMEQTKKMFNQESFLRQRIIKANEQLKKQRKDNWEKEMTQVMFQSLIGKGLHTLNMMDLNDLGWVIEKNLKDIQKKFESINNKNAPPPPPPHMAASSSIVGAMPPNILLGNGSEAMAQVEGSGFEINMDFMQSQPWFMDFESLNNKDTPPPPPPPQVAASSSTVAAAPLDAMIGNGSETTAQVEESAFEMNMESMQSQPWFMDLMNPQEHMGFGDDEMMLPFSNNNPNDIWSNGF